MKRREAEKLLADAEPNNPSCGSCGDDTVFDGEDFVCESCGLMYDPSTFEASYLDYNAEPCGKPCLDTYHTAYDCGTCLLPAGHSSGCDTSCRVKREKG